MHGVFYGLNGRLINKFHIRLRNTVDVLFLMSLLWSAVKGIRILQTCLSLQGVFGLKTSTR